MTIWEFAKKAGVSIATISRAMNPGTRHKVSKETLERIDALAKKYGYTPSLAAKNLRGGAYRTIGVLMPHLEGIFYSNYYAKILSGVADALLDTGYRFKAILLKPEPRWDKYDFKTGESIDGLIVTHWPNFFSEAPVLDKLKVPLAVISDPESGVKARFAGGDNEHGGRLAAEHLLKKGHRKAVVLTGEEWSSDSNLRIAGFRAAFEKGGGRIVAALTANFQEDLAGRLAAELWKKGTDATAIFACNDLMACGALKSLAAIGVKCPEDVSVVGYDDDERAQTSTPPLTTVRVPLYTLTKQVTRELVGHLGNKKGGRFTGSMTFPVELVERSSVGKAKA